MFTGIVEEIGIVKNISVKNNQAGIEIQCKKVLEDTKLGDSIAVDGVCQTVIKITSDTFLVDVSRSTLDVTNFSKLKPGSKVNLERALTLNTRLGGHIVSGHVDCCSELLDIQKSNNFYNLIIKIPQNFTKYVIKKGSITLNGISLTVGDITDDNIFLAIIPHTFENTNLQNTKIGDKLNTEFDILGKYVEKMLSPDDNTREIDIKMLQENGFI